MGTNKDSFFSDNLFRFTGYSCYCAIDTVHNNPGSEPDITLKIQGDASSPIEFAYAASDGLVRIEKNIGIVERNILGSLLSTKDNDINSLISFFSNNGFLFPTPDDSYESINASALMGMINRIKATVHLMSEISEARRFNYKRILDLTLYLLLVEQPSVSFSNGISYAPCDHLFIQELGKASMLTDSIRQKSQDNQETYEIDDLVYSPSYHLDIDEYNRIVGGYMHNGTGANDSRFKSITKLYCNSPNLDPSIRLIIDFMFHYEHRVGIIKSVSFTDGIEYYNQPNNNNFDKPLKQALLKIARFVIGEEINSHLSEIRPSYDFNDMHPSWQINTLMDAIYFSIFYLKPDLELYRKCENPSCDNYFLVKTTSTKKKYCCENCANAAQQRRYRLRMKKAKIKSSDV